MLQAEYQESQQQLEECKQSKIPNCAPCKCASEGAKGLFLTIAGGLCGLAFLIIETRTINKKKAKLKLREEAFEKKIKKNK